MPSALRLHSLAALASLVASACSSDKAQPAPPPAPTSDATHAVPDGSTVTPEQRPDAQAPFDAGNKPAARIEPVLGELTIVQLDLPAGLTLRMGESAIVVGPNGTLVLIDAGNTSHDDDMRKVVRRLNTEVLTPARGFPARSPMQVDWLLVTHFHSDHVGSLSNLLSGKDALSITHGIVHRGFVDVGAALNEGDFEALCTALRGPLAAKDVSLCGAPSPTPCSSAQWSGDYPASQCDGLLRGDLANAGDDAAKQPSFIDLGGGARLELLAANGWARDGSNVLAAAPAFGHGDSNEENARSVAGIIQYGAFRYHFAGDMTGSGGASQPDIESHLVTRAAAIYGDQGVDVVHANHHARRTSSNASFVAKLAPSDGRARNVIAGINAAYLNSPHGEVLTAWGDRLGGGFFWITDRATAGDTHPKLIDAGGDIVLQTVQGGGGYWIQAAATLRAESFVSIRR